LGAIVVSPSSTAHWIDGSANRSSPAGHRDVVDPASGEVAGSFPLADAALVDAAVLSASRAQAGWWALGAAGRSVLLVEAGRRIREAAADLAVLESLEMGKPIAIARLDIAASAAGVVDAAQAAVDILTEPDATRGHLARRPYGVAALITPWNYPVCQVLDPLGPLLAAGNTVVVKPSEKAALSVAALGPLLETLPPGVVNIVLGDGAAGAALVEHSAVDLVHFTGSVATGRRIGAVAGGRLLPCFLELGGKDALVIDGDVDPELAASWAADGGFMNGGQVCTSVERVYVHRAIADAFLEALARLAIAWQPGDLRDPDVRMGPMVDEGQRSLVAAHVSEAIAAGGRLVVGGVVPTGPGFFYPPTVVVDPPGTSRLMTEETFGPVLAVLVVDSFEQGIRLADSGAYGLTASAWTNTPEHVALAATLTAGAVTVNGGGDGPDDAPFEPTRASGLGRVHFGPRAIETYTRPYAVSVGQLANQKDRT
jgi:acyl-CoA reductase-like NAD-dependent aldehyde dehydrogenase